MARTTGSLQGFREASAALNEMSKGVARGVGKRALNVPANILADEMTARAPRLSGNLAGSIKVIPEKARKGRPQVGVIADDIAAIQNEFGNSNMAAQPFARPAKDAKSGEMLDAFGAALKVEVDKSVARAARKAARAR